MSDRLFRVPVEIVRLCVADDEGNQLHARRKAGAQFEPIADLYIRNGRFVAVIHFVGIGPLTLSLRPFPVESLAA